MCRLRESSCTCRCKPTRIVTPVSNLQIGYTGQPRIDSSGSPLALNATSNNNVGIGTIAPLSLLHAAGTLTVGSAASAGNPGIVQLRNGGTAPTPNRLAFGTDGTGWSFAIAKNQAGTLSDLMTFQDNGNIGIGTASPAQKLSVAGWIESTSGGLKFPDGTTQSTAFSNAAGVVKASGATPQYVLSSTASAQSSVPSTGGAGLYIDVYGHATPANNFVAFRTSNVANAQASQVVEAMRITSTGQVVIGAASPQTTAKLDVTGDVNVSGTLKAGTVYADYQDVAEWVRSDRRLAPGTVVILNPDKTNEVMPSSSSYDTTVAGVVSAQPGVILGRPGESMSTVATSGRVRVRVDARKGAVHVGDLLVTSDEPGTAMKSQPIEVGGRKFHQPGTILGKALEPLEEGIGEILVLLSMG